MSDDATSTVVLAWPMHDRRRWILVSPGEVQTHEQLTRTLARFDCQVYPKVRVADILMIDENDLSAEQYSYALKSHFDFVVARKNRALFAVEFDGRQHRNDNVRRRDDLKNAICDRLRMPLLRIEKYSLGSISEEMSVLEWLIQLWFGQETIADYELEHGFQDDIDARDIVEFSDGKARYPLDPVKSILARLWCWYRHGQCRQPIPYQLCWRNEESRRTHGFALVEVERTAERSKIVAVASSCRSYNFSEFGPDDFELVEALVLRDLVAAVELTLSRNGPFQSGRDLFKSIKQWGIPECCNVTDSLLLDMSIDIGNTVDFGNTKFNRVCGPAVRGAYGILSSSANVELSLSAGANPSTVDRRRDPK